MLVTRRLAACTAVMGALAAAPVATAGAMIAPLPHWQQPAAVQSRTEPPVPTAYHAVASEPNPNPTCPVGYSGPTNLATGCPWYLMS